ncbi:adenosylmethionine--8-amino-7-oxononanoate transaminase [Conexibacter sp. W3-3-2]|uniref:adenosylmethionine--8-amino-7-oxononanoate transaminase n=1 Tax=Conexibacter sp. W3-3-2 TaxID=2675227 RepID=UPI0035C8A2C2
MRRVTATDWTALLAADTRHVWHPYGPIPAAVPPRPVVGARGVRLELDGGRELIDGMSSWWCAIHGYRHPVLDAAVTGQLGRMAHVMFGGLTHEPGIRLAQRLVELSPAGLEHVFLCDSGSVSIEVAIKMALQFQRAAGRPGRTRLLSLRGGYHGDTFGAMALCDPVGGMHQLFTGVLPAHVFADRPPRGVDAPVDEAYLAHLDALVARHAHELAAVVVEPVLQGAGGMHPYAPAYLRRLRELCDEHGLLLLADEIATGFGRTGALFGCDHAGIAPDILTVGKALTGGYMTLAAALCTTRVAEGISGGEGGALMHGPTFMANPLACATALASLDLLERPAREGGTEWRRAVPAIETALRDGLAPARGLPGVADVRVLGAVGVVQLDHPVDVAAATAAAIAQGVWLRPFRDLVYTMPPYVCEPYDVDRIAAGVVAAAAAG